MQFVYSDPRRHSPDSPSVRLSLQAEATLHLVGLGEAGTTAQFNINGRQINAQLQDLTGLMTIAGATGNKLDVLKVRAAVIGSCCIYLCA
jgi:hypothetical protein